jgi:uncharacterized membrane protein YphA (DoxX/SURF4 family)
MAGYELELALLLISIYLAMTGSFLFSLDKLIFGSNQLEKGVNS